jgi:hypothetical protein
MILFEVVGERCGVSINGQPNKSLQRSAHSVNVIRETRMLVAARRAR